MSPEEDQTRDAVDSEPKHYQLSYSGPPVVLIQHILCLVQNTLQNVCSYSVFNQCLFYKTNISWTAIVSKLFCGDYDENSDFDPYEYHMDRSMYVMSNYCPFG